MAKLNYNRPIYRKGKDIKVEEGNKPVEMNKLNFGKYKGYYLSNIPTNYLEWLISVTQDDKVALKYCRELSKRPKYKA